MTISDYDVSIKQSYLLSAQAQLIAADEDFSREGYVISAWTENADGSGKQYAPEAVLQADEVSADILLWAQWANLLTKVTYNDNTTSSYNVVGELTQNDIIGDHVKSDIVACEIGYSVTSIGELAFDECSSLTSVMIPNSITSISAGAFYRCSGLTGTITIPSSVTSIGTHVFYYCRGLTGVLIPSSVTSIALATFFGCDMLTSVTIPSSVTRIGSGAFEWCRRLTSVDLCNFTDASKIPSCATDSFSDNATDRKFYVADDDMKNAFSTAAGWLSYGADSFVVKTV